MADQTSKAPKYPYFTMKFISLGDTIGQPNESSKEADMRLEQVHELTVSISAYSNKLDESFEQAHKALEWFKGLGVYELGDENIVIVRTQPIMNRDTFLTTEYERRHGFDVVLRVKCCSSFNVGYIEHVEFDIKK